MSSTRMSPPNSAVSAPAKTVALVGNPNTGKTTLFNALTGLAQRVGNYAGVTVERRVGTVSLGDGPVADLVDLPGAYSLAASSPDEMIAVDVLLGQQPEVPPVDVVLSIVDASNVRRNLYLLSPDHGTGLPIVVALNMTDVAISRAIRIDAATLSTRLGIEVIPVCASRRGGSMTSVKPSRGVSRGETRRPIPHCRGSRRLCASRSTTWFATWETTARCASRCLRLRPSAPSSIWAGCAGARLVEHLGQPFAAELADRRSAVGVSAPLSSVEAEARYTWIDRALEGCVNQPQGLRSSGSDRIDRLLTHRLVGLVAFVAICLVIFEGIYQWSAPLMDAIGGLFSQIGNVMTEILPQGALRSLLIDGVVAGVGGVLIFLPQIAILFLFISVLEDCGYMARAAFLMDRLLSRCGLSGQSFIPLLSSFACAVPGIMATRTIDDRRDRIATIAVAPLMSCSARLPVYVLFIAAFIPGPAVVGQPGRPSGSNPARLLFRRRRRRHPGCLAAEERRCLAARPHRCCWSCLLQMARSANGHTAGIF